MKKLVFIVILLSLSGTYTYCQMNINPQSSPEIMNEINPLMQEAQNLMKNQKYKEALVPTDKAIKLAKDYFSSYELWRAQIIAFGAQINLANMKYDKALELMSEAEKIFIENYGPDSSRIGRVVFAVGAIYQSEYKMDSAMVKYQKTLDLYENAFGKDSSIVIMPLRGLYSVLMFEKKYDEALEKLNRIISLAGKRYGEKSTEFMTTQMRLVDYWIERKDYDKAEKILKDDMAICEKEDLLKSSYVDFNTSLGNFYTKLNKYGEATKYYQKALQLSMKDYGREDLKTGDAMLNLARNIQTQYMFRKARTLYQKAYNIYNKSEEGKKQIGRFAAAFGINLSLTGRFDKAEEYAKEALKQMTDSYGEDFNLNGTTLFVLARIQSFTKANDETISNLEKSIKMVKNLGVNYQDYLYGMTRFAIEFFLRIGDYKKTGEYLTEIDKIYDDKNDLDPLEAANLLAIKARYSYYKGDIETAKNDIDQAEKQYIKILGSEAPQMDDIYSTKALILNEPGDSTAEALMVHAYEFRGKFFKEDHPLMADLLIDMADMYIKFGKQALADQKVAEAEKVYLSAANNDRSLVNKIFAKVAGFYDKAGNSAKAEEYRAKIK